jgi:hypothetical protein
MKKRTKKKGDRKRTAKPEVATQTALPVASANVVSREPLPPQLVLDEALREANRRPLRDYHAAIQVLRDEKKFTFREIADWLGEYNIEADHNAVYREYTREMPESVAVEVAAEDSFLEDER